MASLSVDAKGLRRIIFTGKDGKRRTLYMGRVDKRTAQMFLIRIEKLVIAQRLSERPDEETQRWVAGLSDELAGKLADLELIAPRLRAGLGSFLENYLLQMQSRVRPNTLRNLKAVRDALVEFFGLERAIRSVTAEDAEAWRRHMIGRGWGENTLRRRCGVARQFFSAACRQHLADEPNPFADMDTTVRANPESFFFVTREMAQRVLEACPNIHWKIIFALSRYGGLRCPSEHLALKWSDIDWEHGRIRIWSPKTAHHPGGDSRVIPLFPELLPLLKEAHDQAAPESPYVVSAYRGSNANLRTGLERIIWRSGLRPWPKLFNNLRSSRETELAESYPMHVVCRWIGNSKMVAKEHYLQVTDDHFLRASGREKRPAQPASPETASPDSGTSSAPESR